MKSDKTHFEQVPIEVVEKVLRQGTVLASAQRSPAPLPVQEREAAIELPGRPGKGMGKE